MHVPFDSAGELHSLLPCGSLHHFARRRQYSSCMNIAVPNGCHLLHQVTTANWQCSDNRHSSCRRPHTLWRLAQLYGACAAVHSRHCRCRRPSCTLKALHAAAALLQMTASINPGSSCVRRGLCCCIFPYIWCTVLVDIYRASPPCRHATAAHGLWPRIRRWRLRRSVTRVPPAYACAAAAGRPGVPAVRHLHQHGAAWCADTQMNHVTVFNQLCMWLTPAGWMHCGLYNQCSSDIFALGTAVQHMHLKLHPRFRRQTPFSPPAQSTTASSCRTTRTTPRCCRRRRWRATWAATPPRRCRRRRRRSTAAACRRGTSCRCAVGFGFH